MKNLLLLAVMFLCVSCTDEVKTIRTLEDSGFTNIQTTGYNAWGCGEGDYTSTGFRATNPIGKRVSGTVCCGLTKGCTVRF